MKEKIDNLSFRLVCMYDKLLKYRIIHDADHKKIIQKVTLTKEQKKQVDDFFLKYYGKKIGYDWHRYFTGFSGNFDVTYIPQSLYAVIERKLNQDCYARTMSDKNLLSVLFSDMNIVLPKTYLSCVNGIFLNDDGVFICREKAESILVNQGDVFIKPSVDSCSGIMCNRYSFKDGHDTQSGEDVAQVIQKYGDNFICQEIVENSHSVSALHPASLNTFRIISYVSGGKIYVGRGVLRLGVHGNHVDNVHSGGVFVGVEDDGRLKATAYSDHGEEYFEHPDTHIVFKDYKIEGYEKLYHTVEKLHERMPWIGLISWDLTIDENENPVLIEMNIRHGGSWACQKAFGEGVFADQTPAMLALIRGL